jgi:hypothetical protein
VVEYTSEYRFSTRTYSGEIEIDYITSQADPLLGRVGGTRSGIEVDFSSRARRRNKDYVLFFDDVITSEGK